MDKAQTEREEERRLFIVSTDNSCSMMKYDAAKWFGCTWNPVFCQDLLGLDKVTDGRTITDIHAVCRIICGKSKLYCAALLGMDKVVSWQMTSVCIVAKVMTKSTLLLDDPVFLYRSPVRQDLCCANAVVSLECFGCVLSQTTYT